MSKHILAGLRPVGRSLAIKTATETAYHFFEALDCPRSLTAYILLKNREYLQLVELDANPYDYKTAWDFKRAHQASSFLKKFKDFKIEGINRKERAIEKFKEAELLCGKTNQSFRNLERDPHSWDPATRAILCLASAKISRILGDLDLDKIADNFGWGPGATLSATGSLTSAYNKFEGPLDVTSNCLVYGLCCVNSTPSWASSKSNGDVPSTPVSLLKENLKVVKGDEIVFVSKNAKIDRAIGIPPSLNSYIQKGFGAYIRRRLKRVAGIDLNDQTINQEYARLGSLTGDIATMDLSMASDTVSKSLVEFLLPECWYQALICSRSVFATIRETGEEFFLEKFSAMGNGYTFELESLIFYALVESTCRYYEIEGPISVFGDDIICPTIAYERVTLVLNACGFKVNMEKSFSDGPFRESCGKDYYLGYDVRPIFLKESVSNVESLYKLANNVRRYAHSCDFGRSCDRSFFPCWSAIVQRIPPALRLTISEGFGDGGLIENFDLAAPTLSISRLREMGWEGFYMRAITRTPYKGMMTNPSVAYLTALSAIGSEEPLLGLFTHRARTYPKITRILVKEWFNLGPWV